ncbi:MAG: lysophospholipase [Rhodospirillales bacterium]|nr:lysophospholipase [Rhodospirillales bacterium]
MRARLASALAAGLLLLIAACAPSLMPPGPGPTVPALAGERLVMNDGMALPLRQWKTPDNPGHPPRAVIVAVHGFNDYGKAFDGPASWWAERGIATYSFDQRGFGEAPHRGLWAGTKRMAEDLKTATALVRRRHPGVPLYLLGESMGAAAVIVTMASEDPPEVAGVILSAPAVWARETMPFYQRGALWLAARLIPWAKFTGRGLGKQASDNIEMLRALGRDPLVIKGTRVSAMEGLTDLMSEALAAAPRLRSRALVLYGEKDQIVPPEPVLRFWRELPEDTPTEQRRALYATGWHMLLRDLEAELVQADIAAWITAAEQPLPSGADRDALSRLADQVEAAN